MNKLFVQEIVAKKADAGKRLDFFLAGKLEITRSQGQKMIKEGLVEVGAKSATSSYVLEVKDSINIFSKPKAGPKAEIPIIFEDKDILVIDKPSGITAHPAPGENDITVAEVFDKATIVHRLDKGTSGVMVLAKNPKAAELLKSQFQARKVTKKYLALVHGKLQPEEGVIDMPLSRSLMARNKIAPADEGRDAKTLYKVKKYYPHFTLVEAQPKTGRTHQIRVHFSAIGFPLFGDVRYGKSTDPTGRMFLHAAELSFIHPTTGKRVTYGSELPIELTKIIHSLD